MTCLVLLFLVGLDVDECHEAESGSLLDKADAGWLLS
jgi:hypothetical protein